MPLDKKRRAQDIALSRIDQLREVPQDELEVYLQPQVEEFVDDQGHTYQLEILAVRDDSAKKNLRVMVSVSGGSALSHFVPPTRAFIVREDGSFVDE